MDLFRSQELVSHFNHEFYRVWTKATLLEKTGPTVLACHFNRKNPAHEPWMMYIAVGEIHRMRQAPQHIAYSARYP